MKPSALTSLLVTLLAAVPVYAQTAGTTDTTQEQRARGVTDNPEEPDSVLQNSVYLFHLHPMSVKIENIGNILLDPTGAQHHDPLDSYHGQYYLSKGIVGQSHLPIYPNLGRTVDWHYQPDVGEGYTLTPYNIRYYQTRKPYSLLSYSSSLKKEYTLRVRHTQNIMPRWNIALDYLLLNPDPIFSNEDTKNNHLAVTTNYYSADSRYQAYAAILWQRCHIGENGGVADDNTFRHNTLSDFSGIPVNSYTARSLYNSRQLYTHQSYNLVRQMQQTREHIELIVNAQDSTQIDTVVTYDTLMPAPPHIANPGVVGLDFSAGRSARRYSDSTTIHQYMLWLYWTNDAYPDSRYSPPVKLKLALQPRWYRINEHDSLHYHWQTLTTSGQLAVRLGDDTVGLQMHYTLGDSCMHGDRMAAAHFTHRIDSLRSITFSASASSKSPDFFYLHYHSNGYAWDAPSLHKTDIHRLNLRYERFGALQCEITANHINHLVQLTESGGTLSPVQGNIGFWLLQGHIALHMPLWRWLHCDMEQFMQYSSDNTQWDAPLWATKNSIYADFRLFHNAMRMQAGIDIRYHTPFFADAYNAPAGAFVRQRDIEVGNYLWGDLFVNMQVRKVTIFLKAGHLNALWETAPDYFLLPHYPGNKFGIYYGLTWQFFD
ncbi:MAG: hypothetical protein AUK63_527 [bacterium P3]|nr:MAG: hypothetical protein AUK63_527 [bacterium P3]KWW41983.1 MAG: hypothetical protein F083_634 [bacterium F083]